MTNIIAKARWLYRYSFTKPIPQGYRREWEPNKFMFHINGYVLEYPRKSVDKQVMVEKLWLNLEQTLQEIQKQTAQKPIVELPKFESREEVQRKTRYIC